jgi:hypothetical protein
MSIDRYFDKFPIISYANNQVVDITKRVAMLEKVSRNPYAFYPYDIVGDERADQLSSRYYDDSYKSWLLYITNKITDPYYEWYLTEREFLEFLEKKYGSIYTSQQKIKFYRNDWESQESLDVSGYNALTEDMKKYWTPNYYNGNSILSYSRKQIDWCVNTNKIVSYAVANSSFITNENINIYLNGSSLGKGNVVKTSNTHIYVQHVSGYYNESETLTINNGYIFGEESLVNTAVTDVSVLSSNITDDELVYWKPITYYDYEYEKNEFNRSIRIIDKDLAELSVNNLTELLAE